MSDGMVVCLTHLLLEQQQLLEALVLLIITIRKHKLRRLKKFQQKLKHRTRRKVLVGKYLIALSLMFTGPLRKRGPPQRISSFIATTSTWEITGLEEDEFGALYNTFEADRKAINTKKQKLRALSLSNELKLGLFFLRNW
jgi:hypothetical protein